MSYLEIATLPPFSITHIYALFPPLSITQLFFLSCKMEMISNNPINKTLKRYWKRNGYQRLDGTLATRNNTKVIRFGTVGKTGRRFWKLKSKLRSKFVSPLKLWRKFKNGYMNMMLGLAGNVGHLNAGSAFGAKRIPKARQFHVAYSNNEFENKLIYEIYKSMIASRELGGDNKDVAMVTTTLA